MKVSSSSLPKRASRQLRMVSYPCVFQLRAERQTDVIHRVVHAVSVGQATPRRHVLANLDGLVRPAMSALMDILGPPALVSFPLFTVLIKLTVKRVLPTAPHVRMA